MSSENTTDFSADDTNLTSDTETGTETEVEQEEEKAETPCEKKDCGSSKLIIYLIIGILIVLILLLGILCIVFLYLYITESKKNSDIMEGVPQELLEVSFKECGNDDCIAATIEKVWIPGVSTNGFLSPPPSECHECWFNDIAHSGLNPLSVVYDPTEYTLSEFLSRKIESGAFQTQLDRGLPEKSTFQCSITCKDGKTGNDDVLAPVPIESHGKKVAKMECYALAVEKCVDGVPINVEILTDEAKKE